MGKIFVPMAMGFAVIVVGSSSRSLRQRGRFTKCRPGQREEDFYSLLCGLPRPDGNGDGYLLLGPEPANLTRPATKTKSDAALLQTIHEGKPNMPSWKTRLSEEDSRAVLAYSGR